MEMLLESEAAAPRFWRAPLAWFAGIGLRREFWIFFAAAFFFDAGFSVYFFLFNLYLLDLGFDERTMGLVGSALALGSLLATLPAGMLARRFGIRPLLILCFIAAPLMGVLRGLWVWRPAQVGLAFLGGVSMCLWGVCFLPAVARLTTKENRAAAFGLIFSVSIGTSALGGVLCSLVPRWLRSAGFLMRPADVKRGILLASCAVALLGLLPLSRLRLPPQLDTDAESQESRKPWSFVCNLPPFVRRFLPLMAMWTAVQAAFAPFATVHLTRDFNIPLAHIGLIFSTAQVMQLAAGLLTPLLFRGIGLVQGIVATQLATAAALMLMATARAGTAEVAFYLCLVAAQWMSSPGLYNLLMSETPDAERGPAASMTMFCNALATVAATGIAGVLFTHFGYRPVLAGIAALAVSVAILFRVLVSPSAHQGAHQIQRQSA